MNTMLLNLVSTNAGWLARQALKYSAVAAAILTTWLMGQGLDATHAGVIAAGVTSAVLGLLEATLSWCARKYAVPELEAVNEAIESANGAVGAARAPGNAANEGTQGASGAALKTVPVVLALLGVLALTNCAGVSAFLVSPFGQAVEVSAVALGKQLATAAEIEGIGQIIQRASDQLKASQSQPPETDELKRIARAGEEAALQAVINAGQAKYALLTGHSYAFSKNPLPHITP